MERLIPLNHIPYSARAREATERAKFPSREMALDAATIEILDAAGCYSGAYPHVWGYVLSIEAAKAISQVRTVMPNGSSHCRATYRTSVPSSEAMDDYLEALARGVPATVAYENYVTATNED